MTARVWPSAMVAALWQHGAGMLSGMTAKNIEWQQLSTDDMTNLISDEILEAIAIVGPRDEIAPRIHQKLEGIADRVNLVARYTTDENDWQDIVSQIRNKP